MKLRFLVALVVVSLTGFAAQIPEDRGLSGLKQAFDRLDVVASVFAYRGAPR